MFFVIFLASIFPLSFSSPGGKIIGGEAVTDASEFPWMADLGVQYRSDQWYHLCGGAVIHYRWILTAAHCAKYVVKNNLKLNVTLGVVDITNGPHAWTTLVDPEDIIIHENYSSNGDFAVNDLALLRIKKTMLLGRTILPLRLPSLDDSNTFAGEIGTLSGWGFRDTRKRHDPNILYFINEEILSNEECAFQNENPAYPPTDPSEICISTQNGRTACPGDSGSPLIVRNSTVGEVLVGITSYVDLDTTCKAETAGPVVFMRVSYFMDWIEEKTGLAF